MILIDRDTLFEALIPKGTIGLELGVYDGDFTARILNIVKPTHLFLIDCWDHQEDYCPTDDSNRYPQGEKQEMYAFVLDKYKCRPDTHVMRMYSTAAVKTFPDKFFDWIHIDADHLKVKEDLDLWIPKVKKGGWITGHDYMDNLKGTPIPVKEVVDNYPRKSKLYITEDKYATYAWQKL